MQHRAKNKKFRLYFPGLRPQLTRPCRVFNKIKLIDERFTTVKLINIFLI